jgi:hypothetical protein
MDQRDELQAATPTTATIGETLVKRVRLCYVLHTSHAVSLADRFSLFAY